jgi:hypothetical protein
LPVKSLPVETGASPLDGFNELRKERPHSKTVVETDGGRLPVVRRPQSDTDVSAAICDRGDQLWWDIMRMYIDGHGYSLGLPPSFAAFTPYEAGVSASGGNAPTAEWSQMKHTLSYAPTPL